LLLHFQSQDSIFCTVLLESIGIFEISLFSPLLQYFYANIATISLYQDERFFSRERGHDDIGWSGSLLVIEHCPTDSLLGQGAQGRKDFLLDLSHVH
jgi:hypothetical protein